MVSVIIFKKYVKKNKPVEVIQWDGSLDVLRHLGIEYKEYENDLLIRSGFNRMQLKKGDYIIREYDKSGYYVCLKKIFEDTYEPLQSFDISSN